ncbi:MAG TPA: EAL domain-containing protein, partial [Novosphingobium sp.]
GFAVEVLEGLPLATLLRDGHGAADLIERLGRDEPFRAVPVSVLANGEERWWSVSGRPIAGADGTIQGWRGFIADQTEAKRAEAHVAWLAHYDGLTGLCNRALLQANLERLLARCQDGKRLALLYIDLDHFKEINDGLGHEVGDAVLVEVARRLEAVVRPLDLTARLGGDEFVIVAHEAEGQGAQAMAERILEAVARPIEAGDHTCHVGASIGLAFAPHDAASVVDLLRAADVAMYSAKAGGRQRVAVFDPAMEQQLRQRRTVEIELRAALRQGQLVLYYQPLLDLATGQVTGYEALIRWNHPERGLIHPADFIPIAEETGLIVEIGRWVIREAVAEAAGWEDNVSVAVNLSPVQMRDAELLPTVINALAGSGVAPSRLELEITESTLLHDSAEVMQLLHRLRAIGVRIALDDFGTGYSSLNYLRAFPFDKIKIDRCFISELSTRDDCQAIVRSVLSLASELNMVTTAEGVEALDQLEALRQSGCDQVQGFLFSNPLPAAQVTSRVAKPARRRSIRRG